MKRKVHIVMVLVLYALGARVASADPIKGAGVVTSVAGPVTVARTNVSAQPLKYRDPLYWRDWVETKKDGLARVLLRGNTTVTMRELSRLELREEATIDGMHSVVELVSGTVRASAARMLMRSGERVEVRTRNAVASVRGTDLIVETTEPALQVWAFGLLGGRGVAQLTGEGWPRSIETVVITLSGLVEVSNPLSSAGWVVRIGNYEAASVRGRRSPDGASPGFSPVIGAYEAARVSGRQDPVRFQVSADDLKFYLEGLSPRRPKQAWSVDRVEAVTKKVEMVALAHLAAPHRFIQPGSGSGPTQSGTHGGAGERVGEGGNQLAFQGQKGLEKENYLLPGQGNQDALKPPAPAAKADDKKVSDKRGSAMSGGPNLARSGGPTTLAVPATAKGKR